MFMYIMRFMLNITWLDSKTMLQHWSFDAICQVWTNGWDNSTCGGGVWFDQVSFYRIWDCGELESLKWDGTWIWYGRGYSFKCLFLMPCLTSLLYLGNIMEIHILNFTFSSNLVFVLKPTLENELKMRNTQLLICCGRFYADSVERTPVCHRATKVWK